MFDKDPTHDKLKVFELSVVVKELTLTSRKNETDPLLEQVFVYDFVAQPNLGW